MTIQESILQAETYISKAESCVTKAVRKQLIATGMPKEDACHFYGQECGGGEWILGHDDYDLLMKDYHLDDTLSADKVIELMSEYWGSLEG